jgi:hypothetical protein
MSACEPVKQEKDKIERLADYVDEKFIKTPKFMGWKLFLKKNGINIYSVAFFTIMLMFLVVFFGQISNAITLNQTELQTGTTLALYLALGAGLTAIMNLFVGVMNFIKPATFNEDIISYNYSKLKVGIQNEGDLPLLKALIIIKNKNPEFSLKTLLKSSNEVIIREKLFEILCLTNADL